MVHLEQFQYNMRNLIYFVLIPLLCSCSKNESRIPNKFVLKSSKEITIVNDVVYFNLKKYSGHLYELYPSKDSVSSEGFVNGQLDGICKKWYPNKQLMEERTYLNGGKNGKQVAYWENGNKRFEFIAKKDAYEGEMREWTSEGELTHLANYKDGQEEGIQKLWYENGKIRANYIMIKGKRYGLLGTKVCKNESDIFFAVK